ncbi:MULTISPECIES: crossover junction endodeoxyribonuclease RuvC [Pandoraea]|uniref:Crossover junction endodeoxyribonuclease RuvC n=1 Tax=Pandoraea capi TaxID=2508286 RepID=A0ABY6W5V2_9BURK|nr:MULTISPECIES: crossover junction endodeoxyribonuclease RuvC [Pandoraea]ODP35457.1 crossover junction endodeoxyribonuclease RuvC [Pandoraea sp. ISTKB]VVE22237.1 crossover junction endodeoxyribonuclease RuvC [Pandoraea capi]
MRILGIDPGLRVTGFGVLEKHGNRLQYVTSGVIRTGDGTLAARLRIIFESVAELVDTYRPDQAAIEKVFVNVNPQSTLLLGQARGAAITALSVGGLEVFEYTPMQLKQAVVGYGRARKEQVQEMVTRLLTLTGTPGKDASDALGVAICHAHNGDTYAALSEVAPALAAKGLRVKRGRLVG